MRVFTAPDYLTLQHRSDLNFLVARWMRPVSDAETRKGYALILATARACACPYWLLDGRRRNPAEPATTRWGLEEFFPQLSATLGQPVFMSQLLSPTYQTLTDNQLVFREAEQESPAQGYYMRRFDDETQAVNWLREKQPAS